MLGGLLALAIFAGMPANFAFRYETGRGNLIDTIDGTVSRDNCFDPPESTQVKLTNEQLQLVYDRLMQLRAIELEEPQPAIKGEHCGWAPLTWTRIDLRAEGTIKHYWFDQGTSIPCGPRNGLVCSPQKRYSTPR